MHPFSLLSLLQLPFMLSAYNVSVRRRLLQRVCGGVAAIFPTVLLPNALEPSIAIAVAEDQQLLPPLPDIKTIVTFRVRIARSDGTFASRENDDDPPFVGDLRLGLFETTKVCAENFLSYARPFNMDGDAPSFARSNIVAFKDEQLIAGVIPGLTVAKFGGGIGLEYGGSIKPVKSWVEEARDRKAKRLRHDRPFLLSHNDDDVTPTFSITTMRNPSLDFTNTVFGVVLDDKGKEVIQHILSVPTYSAQARGSVVPGGEALFDKQNEFFLGLAKSLGDTRVGKAFEGKLLRRVEVVSSKVESSEGAAGVV